ncbi:hypothetical protein [Phaeodactylibacter xiamenensis]|uniref:hypothetical protein n=1 Tax=Phaeodactylibacter xiamenensis TaxID=1524460 RepID=UPI0024A98769|nr:hypothetical protein [Phaeodactylibacter xiamenensis]
MAKKKKVSVSLYLNTRVKPKEGTDNKYPVYARVIFDQKVATINPFQETIYLSDSEFSLLDLEEGGLKKGTELKEKEYKEYLYDISYKLYWYKEMLLKVIEEHSKVYPGFSLYNLSKIVAPYLLEVEQVLAHSLCSEIIAYIEHRLGKDFKDTHLWPPDPPYFLNSPVELWLRISSLIPDSGFDTIATDRLKRFMTVYLAFRRLAKSIPNNLESPKVFDWIFSDEADYLAGSVSKPFKASSPIEAFYPPHLVELDDMYSIIEGELLKVTRMPYLF